MKVQTFGLSSSVSKNARKMNPGRAQRRCNSESLLDYRNNRENGDDIDNPTRAFPGDGTYSDWIFHRKDKVGNKLKRIKYTEGPGDRAWMEEKDRNYLARIKREEQEKKEKKVIIEKPETRAAIDPIATSIGKRAAFLLVKQQRIQREMKQQYATQFAKQLSQLSTFNDNKERLKLPITQRHFVEQFVAYIQEECLEGELSVEDFMWEDILENYFERYSEVANLKKTSEETAAPHSLPVIFKPRAKPNLEMQANNTVEDLAFEDSDNKTTFAEW